MTNSRTLCLILAVFFSILPVSLFTGCSAGSSGSGIPGSEQTASESENKTAASADASKNVRPNTPNVHMPEASGTTVIGADPLLIDVSHTDKGYLMALYSGTAAKANIQITGPDGVNYKYFIPPSDEYVAMPLTGGSGTYTVATYENVAGDQYASLSADTLEVTLENDYTAFLYPNQYVSFHPDSQAVITGADVVKDATDDLDAVDDIYHYVIEHITYDKEKADTVKAGYLPDVDDTLATGKGICFDYAALMTAMLRSQNIPAKLEIGYSGKILHSWISVYIKDVGWIDKIIEFDGVNWKRMDPTFASSNKNSEKIIDYIGDGTNYTLQYTR